MLLSAIAAYLLVHGILSLLFLFKPAPRPDECHESYYEFHNTSKPVKGCFTRNAAVNLATGMAWTNATGNFTQFHMRRPHEGGLLPCQPTHPANAILASIHASFQLANTTRLGSVYCPAFSCALRLLGGEAVRIGVFPCLANECLALRPSQLVLPGPALGHVTFTEIRYRKQYTWKRKNNRLAATWTTDQHCRVVVSQQIPDGILQFHRHLDK